MHDTFSMTFLFIQLFDQRKQFYKTLVTPENGKFSFSWIMDVNSLYQAGIFIVKLSFGKYVKLMLYIQQQILL